MCEYSVNDHLQLSQVGQVGEGFDTDGGQLVVAKISKQKKKEEKEIVQIFNYKSDGN